MNSKTFAGAILLASFFLASQAGAYTYRTCGGENVVWDDPFEMVQQITTIPPGSDRENALDNGIGRWNGVRGMQDMVSKSSTVNPTLTIIQGDGQNDVASFESAAIGGNLGLTITFRDTCFWGGDMEWVEADVIVASNSNFGHVGESLLAMNSGRDAFLHQFGHALGLGHHQRFNIMRTGPPLPHVGGPGETVDVLSDDANGGRFLYPALSTEINVFASAQNLNGSTDKIQLNGTGTVNVCSSGGSTLTIPGTVANNGNVDVTITHRWWVSTSDHAHNGSGTQIGQVSNKSLPANTVSTKTVNLHIPALPVGTYFLYHGINLIDGESRTDDNAVREALKIKVVSC
jgi:hypothetical protein